jgi:multidrug efflux system outer membrane protein
MSAYLSPRLAPLAASASGVLALVLLLAGCASRGPGTTTSSDQLLQQAGVPSTLPVGAGAPAELPPTAWRDWVREPRLVAWVELALTNNRDLRVALLNVQRAQAQLTATEANRLPTLGAGLNAVRTPNIQGKEVSTLTAGLSLSSWEIDLFGRLANLNDAARAQLLSTEAGRRAAELTLVAAVVQAGLALQADDELLALARQSLDSREQTLKLTALRESAGAASLLDLQAQQTLTAQGRVALAQFSRQQSQDLNSLALLLGQPVTTIATIATPTPLASVAASNGATSPPALTSALADERWLAEVPAGLSSTVLLRRPDVIAAEQTMRAAQANIGAARAAFWPTLSLTGQAGVGSSQLSGLFNSGAFVYTLAANALLTVFDAGRRQANVESAEAAQQIAQAQYERAIQSAFRDTADGLAGLATWRAQALAQRQQRDAARDTARLVDLKARQGAASVLEQLDAQRSLFAAEQAVVQVRLAELNNRVALYKALGG